MADFEMVPFPTMVRNLFKVDIVADKQANSIMHAAVGVMGEVVELRDSTSGENALEECGDIEFYLEALTQAICMPYNGEAEAHYRYSVAPDHAGEALAIYSPTHLLDMLVTAAGDLLDIAKKIWVYQKPVQVEAFIGVQLNINNILGAYYDSRGLDPAAPLVANQKKLAVRYPDGVYSNEHAQQRLDKVEDQKGAQDA